MSGFEEERHDTPWESPPGGAASEWELTAAAVELALLSRGGTPLRELPADLAERIRSEAWRFLPQVVASPPRPEVRLREGGTGGPSAGRSWLVAGWWTAACLAVLIAWQWSALPRIVTPPDDGGQPPSLAELRGRLLTADPGAVTAVWKKAGDDPSVIADQTDIETAGGLGDVVWSPARQQGFMRFRGLAANDPTVAQYQLWIFDAERDEAYPVDGGVFDVPAQAEGDVVVRIDPRLPITRATAFAITVEQPGGVVVSSRERLPLLATLP